MLKENVDSHHLERIVEFLQIFADRCHHGKEEDLLFPELEKGGVPREKGPIGVMLLEHRQGRSLVKGMGEASGKYKQGDSPALFEFAKRARDYIALLTQHINKENNVLFPMGERDLSAKKQEELVEAFERLEREKIGEPAALRAIVPELQAVYAATVQLTATKLGESIYAGLIREINALIPVIGTLTNASSDQLSTWVSNIDEAISANRRVGKEVPQSW